MSPILNFLSQKKRVLAELESAIINGSVDKKIIPILEIINSHADYYTTSSCSGRVLLLSLVAPGAKSDSVMLNRWHNKINIEELKVSLKKWLKYPYLYYLAQPAIFHITTHDLDAAILLRNLGESAGFKYTSFRSIKVISKKNRSNENFQKEMRITVEILGTERLNVPLGVEGRMLVDNEYLALLVKLGNSMLSESDKKIKKLELVLKDGL